MAIIYSYPQSLDILGSDLVIGTTTMLVAGKPKNQTKSFSMSGISNYVISNIPRGTLSKSNDTNVTLTLTGTPVDSLFSDVSINVGWTGLLADERIASASDWNAAYNSKINSASVTGENIKTLTLFQQDGGEIQASWEDGGGDDFVPYTGATGPVNLGPYDLTVNEITVGKGGGNDFYSTAIGLAALQNNTTGIHNTAFGYTCLYENTTGKENTAVGVVALRNNTSGYSNTAIGSFSMQRNTTGFNNTALGHGSRRDSLDSSGDTSIGAFSFFEKVTGSNNTGLGRSVGYSMVDGNENVFIGWNAGRLTAVGQDSNTISNNSIYIGSHATTQLDNQANQIAIGHFAQGLGSNTTVLGNSMTARTAIYGNLLLGNTVDTGEKLQVTGGAKITNDSKISGLTIGKGLGGFDSNTVLGLDALSANTTGVENTAIGWQALAANTIAEENTAVGYASMQLTTIGNNNSAFGWKSLQASLLTNNNTAIGNSTLSNITIGDNNTALGQAALKDIANGANNTAVGQGSLFKFNTGDNNTAVGQLALYNSISGANNTTIGQNALFSTTTGSNNAASGQSAMSANTTGANNTAHGQASLSNNTTGSNNVALGRQAGTFLPDKTSIASILNTSIMIGTRTSPAGSNQSNQIVIGHDANGLGSNTTVIGNVNTLRTALYGNLLIGQVSDNLTDKLQLTGSARIIGSLYLSGSLTAELDSVVRGITVGRGNNTISTNANTAFGQEVLSANRNGANNTGVGQLALAVNENGSNNTAVGGGSMSVNVDGGNNTALGYRTLVSNTTGGNNTAIGSESLGGNGGNNTANGALSMHRNSSGSNNSALGQSSLTANASGSNNIALGKDAGSLLADKLTDATILNTSIMLGNRTSPLGNNQSNQIVIGHDSNGLGSNTTVIGNSSTAVTAIYGRTVFGATSVAQSAQLQVESTTRGVIVPRMTTAQVNAIVSPSNGLIVYNTTLNTLCFYIAFGPAPGWQRVTSLPM